MLKILYIIDKDWNTHEQVIKNIFGRYLPSNNVDITLIARKDLKEKNIEKKYESLNKYHYIYYYKSKNILKRIFNNFSMYPQVIHSILANRDNDIIQVRNNISFLFLAIAISKTFKNKPKIGYRYSFPIYDENYINKQPKLRKLILKFERKVFLGLLKSDSLDFLLPISNNISVEMERYYIAHPEKVLTLPMAAEPINVDPRMTKKAESFKKQIGLTKNDFTFIYLGTMSENREIFSILECMKNLKEIRNIKLVCVGEPSKNLLEWVNLNGLEKNILFTGWIDFEEVKYYLMTANVGLSLVPSKSYFLGSSPTKFFEYMAVGLPVIANKEIHEHVNVFKEVRFGKLVDYNLVDLTCAMRAIYHEDKELLQGYSENGAKYIKENRNYYLLSQSLLTFYNNIVIREKK